MPPSGGYNPKVFNPTMSNDIPQMKSNCFQRPFFFGGSQIPSELGLSKGSYSGSGFTGDTPPRGRPIFRDDGQPINKILKYPTLSGSGFQMPLKR